MQHPHTPHHIASLLATDAPPSHLEALNMFLFAVVPRDEVSADVVIRCSERIAERVSYYPWYLFGNDIQANFRSIWKERLSAAERWS